MPNSKTLVYGTHPDQQVQCRVAPEGRRGTAVLVHGGYWRERFTAELMDPIVEDLSRRGWATANVEYRRGPQAVWPAPLGDVRAGCAAVAAWAQEEGIAGPLIGVGHSVGGQLALLTGAPLDGVVALAPVTDAVRTYAEKLGDDAAAEYFRATPAQAPERYAGASALAQLPVGRPTLLVHGGDDDRVPVGHSLDFLGAALAAGDAVTGLILPRLSHLAAIDPTAEHWPAVADWMAGQDTSSSTPAA